MKSTTFYARTSDHGYETCVEHLSMAGCLAGGFAQSFGYLDDGLLAGLVHDLGKYSDAFQRRIQDPDHSGLVDHSTAGAMLLVQNGCSLASMAVAGHHAGLPDYGSQGELEGPTYCGRMNKAFSAGNRGPLALADAWQTQLDIPQSAFLKETRPSNSMARNGRLTEQSFYSDMMLTRMLFSTLVDGDRLDAEFFTSNRENRVEHRLLESLKERLGPKALANGPAPTWNALREAAMMVSAECDAENRDRIRKLTNIIEGKASQYLDNPNKKSLDVKRCELLAQCLACGKDASYGTGLYTLTAPTGSGKTISSIAFALEHAHTNNLQRVIYVIPYMSIIDQTVSQFEKVFGEDAVLPHYSEAPYQLKDESDMNEMDLKRALAAENWNAPIVVTTAVQFFESLYSNKTSRCRKLHNMANSVIVFDEAQTLPVPYLRPCIRAIAELVEQYGSTAVLCTATQPELQPLFDEFFGGNHVQVPEISPFTNDDRDSFRRVTIERIGDVALDTLAAQLGNHKQVLCVVNTRKKAQYLYGCLAEDDCEGSFCLTTLQCAADRQRLLGEIRDRLDAGKQCRVVSTSLIEAGVDIDFPTAYREETGLDSIIQTAGRCNREGRHSASESMVYVFSTEGGCAPFLLQNIAAFRTTTTNYDDRDYVQMAMDEQAPWRIYIQNRRTLNRLDSEALEAEHIDARPEDKDFAKEIKALKKDDPTLDLRLRDYMCSQFFDIRTFGAVMTTFVKGSLSCGQVRGPVQFGFARSIDPVNVQEVSITRIAVTTEADAADKNNTMGNKFIIPYGLYRMNGYISAKLAQNVTGFCDEDLDMLWQAILNMFELDRSAARGNMAVRKLYVFKHNSALGDAPSWKLFDSIDVHKRDGVDVARSFSDYEVQVNHEAIPDSVSVSEMVDRAL